MADIDWNDPCARAAKLSEAYHSLLSGSVSEVTLTTDGITQHTKFAGPEDLRKAMVAAQDECARLNGRPGRRRPIQFGARRSSGGGFYP